MRIVCMPPYVFHAVLSAFPTTKAERGMLPAVFAKRGPHGISTLAIVASGTGVAFLGLLGFEAIVEILNLLCEIWWSAHRRNVPISCSDGVIIRGKWTCTALICGTVFDCNQSHPRIPQKGEAQSKARTLWQHDTNLWSSYRHFDRHKQIKRSDNRLCCCGPSVRIIAKVRLSHPPLLAFLTAWWCHYFASPVPSPPRRARALFFAIPSWCGSAADCFAELLEFAAFVKLRVSHRDLHRPYVIPLGTVGVSLLLLPAAIFVVVLASFSSGLTWVVSGVTILIGWGLYPALQFAKRRQWCEFRPMTPYESVVGGEHPSY